MVAVVNLAFNLFASDLIFFLGGLHVAVFLEGLFGQHIVKKPKMMRPSLDNSFDSGAPIGGSAPSPVASQISNQNKLMKMFSNRDRGRKNKGLKVCISHSLHCALSLLSCASSG